MQLLQLLVAGIWISKSKMEITADHLLSNAIELARAAAFDEARASGLPYEGELVGEHLGVEVDGERFLTHLFGTGLSGYRDWRWAVTLTRADEDATSEATVCDVVLLPGSDALLAPKWIPYHERIQAGDLTPGAIVPTSHDDARLTPGYAALPGDEELDMAQLFELGLGRERVLSAFGRDATSQRWYRGDFGPEAQMAKAAPLPCAACAFFIPMAGSMRSAFGVCANEISPADGHVVSIDHGCGAHSQAQVI